MTPDGTATITAWEDAARTQVAMTQTVSLSGLTVAFYDLTYNVCGAYVWRVARCGVLPVDIFCGFGALGAFIIALLVVSIGVWNGRET